MLLHYLEKFRSWSFGISGTKCKRKCNMHWFLNTHSMLLAYLLTCCFIFWFLWNILCKYETILSKQVLVNLWTCELKQRFLHVWHGIDQTSLTMHWRVAWTSSRMYASQRRTLRATIVTIFSHMTRDVSVFIGRQHTDARYWYSKSVCLSVCLSVRPSVRPLRNSGIVWKRLDALW